MCRYWINIAVDENLPVTQISNDLKTISENRFEILKCLQQYSSSKICISVIIEPDDFIGTTEQVGTIGTKYITDSAITTTNDKNFQVNPSHKVKKNDFIEIALYSLTALVVIIAILSVKRYTGYLQQCWNDFHIKRLRNRLHSTDTRGNKLTISR
ncbi:hypothetical protein Btru_071814 [Bulinus truncatus]|nr:hypothetical protein Btru_071814 [Bulinus truncatus]